ncbi:complement c1q-like protein 2 [Plakobranchus ocellatus]|uniref:Complement c1q-like protein 2 n=1 Tax=Plakobranchus ocellatus TaxID=259542 RepID=A0AAV4DJ83_9GAST|nr:complement c1q-like protein 2 [Plakobranchus ocellatus]
MFGSHFVLTFALSVFHLTLTRSALIELQPPAFADAVTSVVFVTCCPDGTSARARKILVMEIAKDGNTPITNIQPPDVISYGSGAVSPHFEAYGLISDTNISNSYLNLSIRYPSANDAGEYTCVISYIGESGLVTQERDKALLHLNDTTDLSNTQRVKSLETALDNLLERVKVVEEINQVLLGDSLEQAIQLKTLKDEVESSVAFSAAVASELAIATGDRLVFSDVITNEGGGYNGTTGEFTAPKAGLYVFHVVMEIGRGGAVGEITLKTAGQVVAKMYTQDKDFGDQGSISSVRRLKQGDVASVHVFLAGGSNPMVFGERLCVFSGFLARK